jgi:hypothetical protein
MARSVTNGQRLPVEVTHWQFVSVCKQAAWVLSIVSLSFILEQWLRVRNEKLVISVVYSEKSGVICTLSFKSNRNQYV